MSWLWSLAIRSAWNRRFVLMLVAMTIALSTFLLLNVLGNLALAESIKIGLNYPRTGNYKDEGLELRRGALLAVDEINKAGGVLGKPLELLSKNTSSQADKAASNVDYFANRGARMVFGGATSEEAIAAGQRSRERAHAAVLRALGLEPLLTLRLRAGEGVGACLAASMLLQGLRMRRLAARTVE